MSHWTESLHNIGACADAIEWAETQPDLTTAWRKCERGDWMLWLVGRASKRDTPERKLVVRAACECASLVQHVFEARHPDDKRPRQTIETALAYCDGNANLKEVRAAAIAAHHAATTVYAAAYAYAAYDAAYAAEAAVAAYAAAATATVAATATAAYARPVTLKRCADIVRKHIPEPPTIEEVLTEARRVLEETR